MDTSANPVDTDFYKRMVKRLGKKKTIRIAGAVTDLLRCAVKDKTFAQYRHNHADYCNAFGIMQGVAYSLGYDSAASTTDKTKPGYWFDMILEKLENEFKPA